MNVEIKVRHGWKNIIEVNELTPADQKINNEVSIFREDHHQ